MDRQLITRFSTAEYCKNMHSIRNFEIQEQYSLYQNYSRGDFKTWHSTVPITIVNKVSIISHTSSSLQGENMKDFYPRKNSVPFGVK
jgi:hypothetical protein